MFRTDVGDVEGKRINKESQRSNYESDLARPALRIGKLPRWFYCGQTVRKIGATLGKRVVFNNMATFGDIGEQIVFRKEHNFNKKLALSKIGAKETPHWGVDRPGNVVVVWTFLCRASSPALFSASTRYGMFVGMSSCIDDSKRPYSGYRGEL
jgi:hypothetical protein